jgi:hypothetical protein
MAATSALSFFIQALSPFFLKNILGIVIVSLLMKEEEDKQSLEKLLLCRAIQ